MPEIDQEKALPKRPLWRMVSDALESEIRSGTFQPGDRLPSESELSERHGAHRLTVRRALQRLKEKNLVRIEQGRGMFVREESLTHTVGLKSKLRLAASTAGRQATRQFLGSATCRAERAVTAALGVHSGATVCEVETLRLIDGHPAGVTTHFFPMPRFEGIDKKIAEHGSVTRSLQDYGIETFEHRSSRIAAKLPAGRDAELLKQPKSKPILFVTTIAIDDGRVPIFILRTRYSGSWIELTVSHS